MSIRTAPLSLIALLAIALAAYAYLVPSTGVAGTEGAMLALAGSVAILIGAVAAASLRRPGWLRTTLMVLLLLGLIGTALAAWFLHRFVLVAVLALGLVAWFGLLHPKEDDT